LNVTNKSQYR